MKKLPELYKNNNIKPIDNNKKVYYMKNEDMRKISNTSVEEELDNIFHGLGYSYNIPVELVTTKKNISYESCNQNQRKCSNNR